MMGGPVSWKRRLGLSAVLIVLLSFSVQMVRITAYSGKGTEVFVTRVPLASLENSIQVRIVPKEAVFKREEHWYVYEVEQKTNYWLRGTYALQKEVTLLEEGTADYTISIMGKNGDPLQNELEARDWRVVLNPSKLKGKMEQKVRVANP
ncbi:hypothetical protein [Gorillibacterium sp. sgz500922]|uniref:hypothetical protein n=1 Tax=Gorillibacterium sp. sgz500922 TaxID=3446694 RepID=UPI003F6670B3